MGALRRLRGQQDPWCNGEGPGVAEAEPDRQSPSPRPQTWSQKCHAAATWTFQLDQEDDTGPNWEVDFEAHVYAAGTSATPCYATVTDADPNYGQKSGSFGANTPSWAALPAGSYYAVAYVQAKSVVHAYSLIGGSLSASAANASSNWYAEYP